MEDSLEYNLTESIITYNSNTYVWRVPSWKVIWIIFTVLTSIVGLITNGIAITAICKKSYKKSAWDVLFIWYCVLNMCLLIDFMLTAILPTRTWAAPGWMCPVYQFYFAFVRNSTYITLAGLSLVNLVFYKDIEKRCLPVELLIICISIFISTAIAVPRVVFSKVISYRDYNVACTIDTGSMNSAKNFNFIYNVIIVIPPVLAAVYMSTCFLVLKIAAKKVTKAILLRVVITVIFVVVWSPSWILTIISYADDMVLVGMKREDYIKLYSSFNWLMCFGTCLPPIAFLLLNQSARQSLCCCKQNRQNRYELTDMAEEETEDNITLQTNQRQ